VEGLFALKEADAMASIITENVRRKRAEILARDDTDPVLSFDYCAADYGVSRATFRRNILPDLPVVEITDRLRGVRRSDHEARKTRVTRTRRPGAGA
jgi:hypothetical protein